MLTPSRRRRGRLTGIFAGGLAAALLGGALVAPASGAVAPGRIVAAIYNASHAEAEGYTPGASITMTVRRNGVPIGTATGVADAAEGGLAVNPEACWIGSTPEILPGDEIVVDSGVGPLDSMIVQDITATAPVSTGLNQVSVSGTAKAPNGTPLTGEVGVRLINAAFQGAPNSSGGGGGPFREFAGTINLDGTWTAVFNATAQEVAIALDPGTATEADFAGGPNINEVSVYEVGAVAAPFPPCTAPLAKNAVTSANPAALNIANSGGALTLSGIAQGDATAVAVTLSDGPGGGADVVRNATPNATTHLFDAVFEAGSTSGLAAGTLSATVVATTPGGLVSGIVPFTMRKDLTAPPAPTANPAAGTALATGGIVTLNPGAASEPVTIHYTLNGTAPTAASPTAPNPFALSQTTTVRAIAVDAAGNPSPEFTGAYPVVTAGANKLTTTSPAVLNASWANGNASVTVSGTAQADINLVEVRLRHPTSGLPLDYTAASLGADVGGLRDFSATFSHAAVAALADGPLVVEARFTLGTIVFSSGAGAAGLNLTLLKDIQPPGAPVSNLDPGAYAIGVPLNVTLLPPVGESSASVQWTADGSNPLGSTQTAMPITLPGAGPVTIRAVVRDAAGNIGPEASFAYTFIQPGANKVSSTSPTVLNLANVGGGLTVLGTIEDGAAPSVTVTLNDQDPATPPIVLAAAVGQAANGARSWSVSFPSVSGLADGTIGITVAYRHGATVLPGLNGTVLKDTLAPGTPTGSPGPGTFASAQQVLLTSSDTSAVVRFTTDLTIPTATAGALAIGPLTVSSSTIFRVIAVDPAGNTSSVATLSYAIASTPFGPSGVTGGVGTPSAGGGASGAGGAAGGPGTPGVGVASIFTARVAGLTGPRSLRFGVLSAKGVVLTGRAPAGARILRIRIVRSKPGARKIVLTRFQPVTTRRFRITLAPSKIRKIMKSGFTYSIQVQPGSSKTVLGRPTTHSVTVTP